MRPATSARAAELVRQALALVDQARRAAAGRAAPRAAGPLPAHARRPCRAGRPAAGGAAGAARAAVGGAGAGARLAAHLLMLGRRFAEARGLAEEAVAIAGQVGARAEEATPAPPWAAPSSTSATPTPGSPSWRRRPRLATEDRRRDRRAAGDLNHSDALAGGRPPGGGGAVALDGTARPAAWAWPASTGRGWPTTPPRRCSPWAAGTRPSRSPAELAWTSVGAPRSRRLTSAAGRGPPRLELAGTWTPPRRGCRPSGAAPRPIPGPEDAGPLFAGLAELALWRGDLEQARQLVAEAVPLVEADPRYAAPRLPSGCGWRPTAPSWPGPATPASPPPTTPPPPRC